MVDVELDSASEDKEDLLGVVPLAVERLLLVDAHGLQEGQHGEEEVWILVAEEANSVHYILMRVADHLGP